MAKYRIMRSVESAEGWQSWIVEAANEAEALEKHNRGEGEFEAEEVEVTSLGEPDAKVAKDLEPK